MPTPPQRLHTSPTHAPLTAGRRLAWLLVGPVALWALASCTNSGLGAHSGDSGAGTTTGGGDCPWVGEWRLVTIACAAFDDPDWFENYGKATMVVEDDPDGSGCRARASITSTNPACNQDEVWHFSAPVGSSVDIQMDGVTGCQPAACTFPGDAVCTRGDGVRDIPGGYVALVNGNLEARDLLANTEPNCGIEVITTWAPK